MYRFAILNIHVCHITILSDNWLLYTCMHMQIIYMYMLCCSVQWVCPSSNPTEYVLDRSQGFQCSQLVGVSGEGDVQWWRVREGGGEDEGSMKLEELSLLKKAELASELRRLSYGKFIKMRDTCACVYPIYSAYISWFLNLVNFVK